MFEITAPQVIGQVFNAGKSMFDLYQKDQAELAAKVLAKEIAKGRVWAITDDKAAAALWTYLRAAREGAARRNLELMAEAIANGATEPTFAPDEFKRHADTLASLSRDEILILAAFIEEKRLGGSPPDEEEQPLWLRIRARLAATPAFKDEREVEAHTAALIRTGWLLPLSAWGSLAYEPTPLLETIGRLVDFPEAAQREGKEAT